jgi:hypothetical protein
MIKKILLIITMMLVIACCGESLINPQNNEDIVGIWVENKHEDEHEHRVFERENKLDNNKYGFIIESDGKFIERKNSGWCGTPPISFANFNGTWQHISDSILNIEVGYWGGITNYKIKIISLDANELRIKTIYEN